MLIEPNPFLKLEQPLQTMAVDSISGTQDTYQALNTESLQEKSTDLHEIKPIAQITRIFPEMLMQLKNRSGDFFDRVAHVKSKAMWNSSFLFKTSNALRIGSAASIALALFAISLKSLPRTSFNGNGTDIDPISNCTTTNNTSIALFPSSFQHTCPAVCLPEAFSHITLKPNFNAVSVYLGDRPNSSPGQKLDDRVRLITDDLILPNVNMNATLILDKHYPNPLVVPNTNISDISQKYWADNVSGIAEKINSFAYAIPTNNTTKNYTIAPPANKTDFSNRTVALDHNVVRTLAEVNSRNIALAAVGIGAIAIISILPCISNLLNSLSDFQPHSSPSKPQPTTPQSPTQHPFSPPPTDQPPPLLPPPPAPLTDQGPPPPKEAPPPPPPKEAPPPPPPKDAPPQPPQPTQPPPGAKSLQDSWDLSNSLFQSLTQSGVLGRVTNLKTYFANVAKNLQDSWDLSNSPGQPLTQSGILGRVTNLKTYLADGAKSLLDSWDLSNSPGQSLTQSGITSVLGKLQNLVPQPAVIPNIIDPSQASYDQLSASIQSLSVSHTTVIITPDNKQECPMEDLLSARILKPKDNKS